MRRAFEGLLRRMWHGDPGMDARAAAAVAAPLAVLFGGAVRLRGLLFDRRILRQVAPVLPVISVGNLAVGGTGKTPVASWILGVLQEAGWRPALVLRGAGADEVRLHERWHPNVPILPGRRRSAGVERARNLGADIVVLDDGFQHRRLGRMLEIVLLSPEHPLPPRLLPRGPFREPLGALSRADLILVTAKGAEEREAAARMVAALVRTAPRAPVRLFPFEVGGWRSLDGAEAAPPPGLPLVLTSIASPDPFRHSVEALCGSPLRHLAYPDHHPFAAADAAEIRAAAGGGWIATTEKDAVKLVELRELLPEVRVLPLIPSPPEGLAALLLERIGGPGPARRSG